MPRLSRSTIWNHPSQRRRGASLLEVQVAFVVLGIGLAGLCPFVVMQLRQVRMLEQRLQGQVVQRNFVTGAEQTMLQGYVYYFVPWANSWTRKLAGSAQILTSAANACDTGPPPLPNPPPTAYPVSIVELDAPPGSQDITAHVLVTPH
jgi:type II secretory pathway pseudopilin PulG